MASNIDIDMADIKTITSKYDISAAEKCIKTIENQIEIITGEWTGASSRKANECLNQYIIQFRRMKNVYYYFNEFLKNYIRVMEAADSKYAASKKDVLD